MLESVAHASLIIVGSDHFNCVITNNCKGHIQGQKVIFPMSNSITLLKIRIYIACKWARMAIWVNG